MRINLVMLVAYDSLNMPTWTMGEVFLCQPRVDALAGLIREQLTRGKSEMWLFWDSALGAPDPSWVARPAEKIGDLWHAGLSLGMAGMPGVMDFVNPTWMLNRDPPADIEATSWRLSLRACLVRTTVLEQMGFLVEAYQTLEAAGLDWGHRCIRNGVVTRHVPGLIPVRPGERHVDPDIPYEDQLRFVRSRFGKKWMIWAILRSALTRYAPWIEILRSWSKLRGEAIQKDPEPYRSIPVLYSRRFSDLKAPQPGVSIILPTLDRYPYLHTLLQQLRAQTTPPHEVVIIDQTPVEKRPPSFYEEFQDLPIKLIQQETPGQCTSRNHGLQSASGDYFLFIDDDDEVPKDLIEAHLVHMECAMVKVSCGVAQEVGAKRLPYDFTYHRISDVFPTNNTMVHRTVLERSGLFDLAYDRGQRADHDLGMRIYLDGTMMLLEPTISVFHHHAPSGGLRSHHAREITYGGSRASITRRVLPSPSDLYLASRYYTPTQQRESLWLAVFGTFVTSGNLLRKSLKVIYALIVLPHSLWVIWQRSKHVNAVMMKRYPTIPLLKKTL